MGLTISERKAVAKRLALEYRRGDKALKGQILDQVCELNGWHRSHARKALQEALVPKVVAPRPPRPSLYGESVIAALRFLWSVQGTRAGGCWLPRWRTWCPGSAGSASSTSTTGQRRCCCRSRRPRLTGSWLRTGRG